MSISKLILDGKMIPVGEITKPHGIRGGVHVTSFCEPPENIQKYKPLFLADNTPLKITKIQRLTRPHAFIFFIEGIKDRNTAELWRGKTLYIHRDQLPSPEEDDFYYEDLIGLQVEDERQQPIGVVHTLTNFGAQDILVLHASEQKEIMIPFTKEAILNVDLTCGVITVDSRFLL